MSDAGRGLFLDLDGTLADSLPVMRQVYLRFLAEHGRRGTDEEFDRLNGPPLPLIVATLRRTHGLSDGTDALLARYDGLIEAAYSTVPAHDGAHALIDHARRRGRRVAVVTSGGRTNAAAWLATVGLAVDAVIGREDVRRGKPDPEPYLTALARTGCSAEHSIAVEDSAGGAASASAAGLITYRLTGAPIPWADAVDPTRPIRPIADLSAVIDML